MSKKAYDYIKKVKEVIKQINQENSTKLNISFNIQKKDNKVFISGFID